jgi:hypothetical protein
MPALTLDVGGLAMTPDVQAAGHAEPRTVGERRYTFDGYERSMIRAELMTVPVVLVNLQSTDARIVREMFARGNIVPCSGDVFNNAGATVQCSGQITDEAEQGGTEGEELYWVISLTLTETSNAGTASGL